MRRLARYALVYDAGILTGLVLALAWRDLRGHSPRKKGSR